MENIMNVITGAFRGDTLDRLSSQLDTSPAAVERGIAQAVPLSVAGFAEQAKSEHSANDLLARIRDGNYPHLDPSELGQVVSDPAETKRTVQSSNGFMNGFFGNKLNGMLDMVTGASGVSRTSAGTLLGLIAPMVLAWVGSNVKTRGLNANGLSKLLADEEQKVSGRLPAGFGSIFRGDGGAGYESRDASHPREPGYRTREVSQRPGTDIHHGPHAEKRRPRRLPWLLAALAALAAVFSWWVFGRDEQARAPGAEAPRVAEAPKEAERPAAPEPERPPAPPPEGQRPEGASAEPTDVQPVAGKDLPMLRDDARPLETFFQEQRPVPQRFLLEGLVYGTGEAEVVSNPMLDETARILAANPNARARIEGHTDRQGSDQTNQMLSQRRADAVRDYLLSRGVKEDQLTAAGASETQPVANDETPEGRAQNRRVELIITQR